MNQVLLASGKMDWETPDEVLDLVRKVGPIGLDPCTTKANPTRAAAFYTPEDSTCKQWERWRPKDGLVFVNPPYGRELTEWVTIACATGVLGGEEVILLVPARPDTRWWHTYMLRAQRLAFWKGRLRFRGAPASAPFPSVLAYWGPNRDRFADAFAERCWVVKP